MNNGLANLVLGTSTREDGVTVTHLVRGVEFGRIEVTYEHGQVTKVDRTESMKLARGVDAGNVTRLI